jgi:biopolymer transport protein TolR
MSFRATEGGLLKRKTGKKKRAFDSTVNIVPMVDLMASTLCFLLLTASWIQIAKLDANLPSTDAAAAEMLEELEDEEQFSLQLLLTKDKTIRVDRGHGLETIDATEDEEFDWPKLDSILKEVRAEHPDHDSVILSADPELEYEFVIATMDISIANRLPNVSLAASAVRE